jgi:hypothetical protein
MAKLRMKKQAKPEKPAVDRTWLYILVGLLILFIIFYVSYQSYLASKKIEYAGLKFEEKKVGNLTFWYTSVPLVDTNGVNVANRSMYFRNNPKELEYIPINGIIQIKSKIILASDSLKCDDNGIAGGELGLALAPYSNIISGTLNKTLADEKGIQYASCNQSDVIYLDSTVLIFKPGNTTSIDQNGKDCYEITIKDCEVLDGVERFIVGLYAHAKGIEI